MKDAIKEGTSEPQWLYEVRSTEPAMMSVAPSMDESTWMHLKNGTGAIRFMFIYETYGPPGYASTLETQISQIAQGHPMQSAMIDGIARSGKRLLFKYPQPGDPLPTGSRAGVEKNPMPGTWWERLAFSEGQGSLMYYDPYDQTPALLFENVHTDATEFKKIDWEEILSHELYHVWVYSNDDGVVKIGEPSYQEARRNMLPEGYAIRYINKLRKDRGLQFIRLTHDAHGDVVILDGKDQGNVIRLR